MYCAFLHFTCVAGKITEPNDELDSFLSETMKMINEKQSDKLIAIADVFKQAMQTSMNLLGDNAFRKPPSESGRKPINKALFESWSVALARFPNDRLTNLFDCSEELICEFNRLLNDDLDFHNSVSYSTGDHRRVHKRFDTIERMLNEVCE